MLSRHIVVNNGGLLCKHYYFTCDVCGKEMFEGDPRLSDGGDCCPECAYLTDRIDEKTYKDLCFYIPDNYNVCKIDGEIIWWNGKKAPWQKKDRDHRTTAQYKEWRLAVFSRDLFTCQSCHQVRGDIQAHHKRSFKKHPALRFELDNGITFCRSCHIEEHRRLRNALV